MTVVILLAVLVIALVVVIPLLEKSSFRLSPEHMQKWGRWVLPLAILLALAQLIRHWLN